MRYEEELHQYYANYKKIDPKGYKKQVVGECFEVVYLFLLTVVGGLVSAGIFVGFLVFRLFCKLLGKFKRKQEVRIYVLKIQDLNISRKSPMYHLFYGEDMTGRDKCN